MKHAWGNYVKFAWGANELRPVTKRTHNPSIFGKAKFGATIVDATDTLFMMGLHQEYQRARDWIAQNLNVSISVSTVMSDRAWQQGVVCCAELAFITSEYTMHTHC